VVRVDIEEDATSCDGIGATVLATCAVGGNHDCMAMCGEIVALVTRIAVVAGRQVDQIIESRAVAVVMVFTTGSHEVLPGYVAYVVTLIVGVAPVSTRCSAGSAFAVSFCLLFFISRVTH
jgi:hypothetical protein